MPISTASQGPPPTILSTPSALQSLLTTSNSHKSTHHTSGPDQDHHHHLALQIAHNLKHQHLWRRLRLHTHSSLTHEPLPRPILSGLPPRKLYTHPDEQIELLQRRARAASAKTGGGDVGVDESGKNGAETEEMPEREWVVPCHLRERWSLARFGEVFEGIRRVPGLEDGMAVLDEDEEGDGEGDEGGDGAGEEEAREIVGEWREKLPKRILLATLDDDSTVVYYIVHDGIVKPRQN